MPRAQGKVLRMPVANRNDDPPKISALKTTDHLPDLARFLDGNLIMNYLNGEPWYDIHPLLLRVSYTAEGVVKAHPWGVAQASPPAFFDAGEDAGATFATPSCWRRSNATQMTVVPKNSTAVPEYR